MDEDNRFLFTANYTDGTVSAFSIKPDGSLGSLIVKLVHEGSGPNPQRQKTPHAHFVMLTPDEKHLCAVDLGIDKIMVYDFDKNTGTLTHNPDLTVSVNVAAHQMQQPDFTEHLRTMLAAHPEVDPTRLELEVVETSLLEDMAHACDVIDNCRELGVRFALDDFGTGYSSLSYIKRFPVDVLKVDKSFVRDMSEDNSDRALVGAIINMARSLELTVVAEGVETQRQLDLLEQEAEAYSKPPPPHLAAADSVALTVDRLLSDARDPSRTLWVKAEHGQPDLTHWRGDSWFASPSPRKRPKIKPGDLAIIYAQQAHACYAVVEVTSDPIYDPTFLISQGATPADAERWPWISHTRERLVPDTLVTVSREEISVEPGGLQNGHSRMTLAGFTTGVRHLEQAAAALP